MYGHKVHSFVWAVNNNLTLDEACDKRHGSLLLKRLQTIDRLVEFSIQFNLNRDFGVGNWFFSPFIIVGFSLIFDDVFDETNVFKGFVWKLIAYWLVVDDVLSTVTHMSHMMKISSTPFILS